MNLVTQQPHIPVLLTEVLDALAVSQEGRKLYIDGTFGAGGYSTAILDANPEACVLAFDRDPDAIEAGQGLVNRFHGRLSLVKGEFGDLESLYKQHVSMSEYTNIELAGIVLDIGVSSMQLDQAARGFSFRFDGPLDMRMGQSGESAADIVNSSSEERLADIFYYYGEERRARAIARLIVERRREAPITTTRMLADLVSQIVHVPPNSIHPATRTFQALRIAVNNELGELVNVLNAAEQVLKTNGRLVVVSFHSLEDRLVKQFFASRTGKVSAPSRHQPAVEIKKPSFQALTRNAVIASQTEIMGNPRARSAKLRAAFRTDAPPLDDVISFASGTAHPQGSKR